MINLEEKPSLEKRSVIVVGKTGVGKSKLLNEIICEKQLFKSSSSIDSCTERIESSHSKVIKCKIDAHDDELAFELKVWDTPGICDSKGRSKRFLNEIAQTLKRETLNLIIILVDYQRLDTGLCNCLEVLRECLNDLSQSSSMLIVNKVPTLNTLNAKRARGEEVPDRDIQLETIFKKLSDLLGTTFKYQLYLENDEPESAINEAKYNWIRQTIYACSSRLDASKVKTWDELVTCYGKEIESLSDQDVIDKANEISLELKSKLDKVEFDIADVKYSFLDFLDYVKYDNEYEVDSLIFSSLEELKDFVLKFECQITKEAYYERSKISSDYLEYLQNR